MSEFSLCPDVNSGRSQRKYLDSTKCTCLEAPRLSAALAYTPTLISGFPSQNEQPGSQ